MIASRRMLASTLDRTTRPRTVATLLICLIGLCVPGCPPAQDGNGGSQDPLTGAIVSLNSDIVLSGNQRLTIIYRADERATQIDAFYVPMSSNGVDVSTTGPRTVFGADLATGNPSNQNQTVELRTDNIAAGIYRVGVALSTDSLEAEFFSTGSFQITSLPDPVFTNPNLDMVRDRQNSQILVRAELGDPENAVQWRMFFIPFGSSCEDFTPAGQLGTQIATGTQNIASTTWETANITRGSYQVGISVTDSGDSVAETSASGDEERIKTVCNPFRIDLVEQAPQPMLPAITISEPAGSVTLFEEETTFIRFNVNFTEGNSNTRNIAVFIDSDGLAETGDEIVIDGDLPESANAVALVASNFIDVGQTVQVGVTASDGVNAPVTKYATGDITLTAPEMVTLSCQEPSMNIDAGPDQTITISWNVTGVSSVQDPDAEFRIFIASAADTNGLGTLISTNGINARSTTFTTTESGRFRFTVRLVFGDEDPNAPAVDDSPCVGEVTVSTLPRIFWLGELPGTNRSFAGAIFEGVNFEDNAGTAFEGDEDFDGDGLSEFVIVSRFGKPGFFNQTGIGAGEAYFIRGRPTRYLGLLNLNAVGSPTVPGLVVTGIEPVIPASTANPPDTDGISTVFISRGGFDIDSNDPLDADGDGIGELIFGQPRVTPRFSLGQLDGQNQSNLNCDLNPWRLMQTNSMGQVFYDDVPQFHRGGIVIVSSLNDVLAIKDFDAIGFRISLEEVGQDFESSSVSPEPGDGGFCTEDSSWLGDRYFWNDSAATGCSGLTPPVDFVGCFPGTDGQKDTVVQPSFGFDYRLADPRVCDGSFVSIFFNCPAELFDEGCPACAIACATQMCSCAPLALLRDQACPQVNPLFNDANLACDGVPLDSEQGEGDCQAEADHAMETIPLNRPLFEARGTGFYRELIRVDADGNPIWNRLTRDSIAGCRMIGSLINDAAGMSITQSDDQLIVSSPFNGTTTTMDGGRGYFVEFSSVFGTGPFSGSLPRYYQIPDDTRDLPYSPFLYDGLDTPPIPHQYLLEGDSNSGTRPLGVNDLAKRGGHWDTFGIDIIGDSSELITRVVAIPDFNQDGRNDVAIGAPLANIDGSGTPEGAVYIIYRRQPNLEGNFRLANLKLTESNPERLVGLMVRETTDDQQRFGESVAGDFDFNDDGRRDVVVGNPDGNGGTGEVVIIFGAANTISGANGIPVDDEGPTVGLLTRRQGARIRGFELGSEFGFNVTNIGDIDGDGENDLAIAAPNASPRFDSNKLDANDSLDPAENAAALPGIDLTGPDGAPDGIADDVTGPRGLPDGIRDQNDELRHAGLVYVILSSTLAADFASVPNGVMDISISQLGTTRLNGFIVVGRRGDRFFGGSLFQQGDFLGGGLAGRTNYTVHSAGVMVDFGGNANKGPISFASTSSGNMLTRERDRSFGIGRAGDVDGDGRDDLLLGAQLADPRVDPITGVGDRNGGEAYLIYGFD